MIEYRGYLIDPTPTQVNIYFGSDLGDLVDTTWTEDEARDLIDVWKVGQ